MLRELGSSHSWCYVDCIFQNESWYVSLVWWSDISYIYHHFLPSCMKLMILLFYIITCSYTKYICRVIYRRRSLYSFLCDKIKYIFFLNFELNSNISVSLLHINQSHYTFIVSWQRFCVVPALEHKAKGYDTGPNKQVTKDQRQATTKSRHLLTLYISYWWYLQIPHFTVLAVAAFASDGMQCYAGCCQHIGNFHHF